MSDTKPLPGTARKPRLGAFAHAMPVIIIYAVLLIMLIVLGCVSPRFPSLALSNSLMISALPLVFAALAQTLVILVKGIDISVGPLIGLVMVVAASLMHDSGWSIAGVVVLCVLIGMVAGAINGALVVFAALAGLTLAAQTMTGDPAIGAPYTLNSIASAVLGGTSLAGGIGGAIGSIGGAFVLTVVVDILFFFRVSSYYQYVFSGAIVIIALAIVTISEFMRSRRAKAVAAEPDGQQRRKRP
jgi:ribose/xylose/arabinose/galactoside ABC-type transport system permease subunit